MVSWKSLRAAGLQLMKPVPTTKTWSLTCTLATVSCWRSLESSPKSDGWSMPSVTHKPMLLYSQILDLKHFSFREWARTKGSNYIRQRNPYSFGSLWVTYMVRQNKFWPKYFTLITRHHPPSQMSTTDSMISFITIISWDTTSIEGALNYRTTQTRLPILKWTIITSWFCGAMTLQAQISMPALSKSTNL